MQMRPLSKGNDKKYRVCDRCDLKLDNFEFENTYKSILKSEEDIIKMHEQKKREYEKKISQAENQEIKQKKINKEHDEQRELQK